MFPNMGIFIKSRAPASPQQRKKAWFMLLGLIVFIVVTVIIASILIGQATNRVNQVEVVISYSHPWSGSLGDLGSQATYEGTGPMTYTITKGSNPLDVAAVIQKQDESSATLTVSIIKMDGTVLKTASTSAAYGVASVVWIDS